MRNILLVLLSLVAIFFLIVVPLFFTYLITSARFRFPDRNNGKTPQSFGLAYQPIEFHSSDGVLLKGWYVPAGPTAHGTIIYCHGRNRSRVEMLPMEVYGHSLGYNGLLFDCRDSGKSGGARYAIINSLGNLPVAYMAYVDGRGYAHWGARGMPAIDAILSATAATILLVYFLLHRAPRQVVPQ